MNKEYREVLHNYALVKFLVGLTKDYANQRSDISQDVH